MAQERTIKVTLVRSPISETQRQRRTLLGLGLTRVGRTAQVRDNAATRGMIEKVAHLLSVES